MTAAFVYMTAKDKQEAVQLGRTLVEDRLVACVNILDQMTSLFWWEERVQEETEVVLVAKTTKGHMPELTERVKQLHSYDCPCIVAWPLEVGNEDYLNWIHDETKSPEADDA